MSLRTPIVESANLPGGAVIHVRVGVPDDPYISRRDLTTVDVELRSGDVVLAAVNTVLDPEDDDAGRELAREIVAGLESGELAPSAAAIEPLADRPR